MCIAYVGLWGGVVATGVPRVASDHSPYTQPGAAHSAMPGN